MSDTAHDFDFFFGTWRVHHRRLRERLAACDDWEECEGTALARLVWGGAANFDEITADTASGPIHGATLRLYDPRADQWRLYWANRSTGIVDPPVIGRFENGRGEFFGQDLHEGRAILVRFIWSDITPSSCRWQQAFSTDGGRTWETNWIMDFTRTDSRPARP